MDTPLFRPEAVAHHARVTREGDILRVDSRWSGWAFDLLWIAAVVVLTFVLVVPIREYASGPAVVRVEGRREVTAVASGTIESVYAQPGETVAAGAVLVRLHDDAESAELARATLELELQLARLLRDPADLVAKQTLAGLRAKRDSAANALALRTLRAPVAGTVRDIHARVGDHVAEGEIVLAIAPPDTRVFVLGVVPGDYRPMLARGQRVRFSLDGFAYDYHDLEVESVSEEAIGPLEAKRYFGPELAEALAITPGAKSLFRARIPDPSFTFEGKPYGYFDGLTGTGEVQVRSEPILVMLVPALRQVWP